MSESIGIHSRVLRRITDSIRLRNAENKLHLNFEATVLIKIPHPAWLSSLSSLSSSSLSPIPIPSSDSNPLWRSLAVEGSQNIPLEIKLLWNQDPFPEEWSHVSESLGRVLSKSQLWQQLGLCTSLQIPSHDVIYITFNSPHYTTLPPTLHLPTSSVHSIKWTFDFSPYATRPKSASLQLTHILPLFDECINLFLNNKAGSLSLTGGLFVPGSAQQIRNSMASVEAITSTLARYASQCDDYTLFRSRIKQIKDKIEFASPIAEQAIDLQKALSTQVYHQVLRALQGTRLRRKTHYRSSSLAENELLSQPLEKFQDLFDSTRNMLSQDDNDDDGMIEDGNEEDRSDFEDLFGEEREGYDNYSDFEDLLEETRAIRQEIGEDMTPDSPTPVRDSTPTQGQTSSTRDGYDMASECSDFGFTMLEDSYATAPSQQYHTPPFASNDEEYDHFTDLEPPSTPVPSFNPVHNTPKPLNAGFCQPQPFWENEESLMMLF
ncbi:hypothetical protein TWF481_009957 [Arthrobotrys musiformis]|uniref:Uncharacterized protein n=1 Tax=Arthrobotrys musiformis TaxID=47236 RepID=A0AAV9VZJ4_9PEZI